MIPRKIVKKFNTNQLMSRDDLNKLLKEYSPQELLNMYMNWTINIYQKDIQYLIDKRDSKNKTSIERKESAFDKLEMPEAKEIL
jgi:hypothetical protein